MEISTRNYWSPHRIWCTYDAKLLEFVYFVRRVLEDGTPSDLILKSNTTGKSIDWPFRKAIATFWDIFLSCGSLHHLRVPFTFVVAPISFVSFFSSHVSCEAAIRMLNDRETAGMVR
jgi:hypothetical protein